MGFFCSNNIEQKKPKKTPKCIIVNYVTILQAIKRIILYTNNPTNLNIEHYRTQKPQYVIISESDVDKNTKKNVLGKVFSANQKWTF